MVRISLIFLQSISTNSSLVIIMGDFNVPDINWSTLVGSTHFSDQFCDLIFDLNLSQLVDSSTHRQGNILDLVLTNIEDSIHSLTVLNRNHQLISSDHYPITFVLSHSVISPHNSPTYFYDFLKGNMKAFLIFLLTVTFLTATIWMMWSLSGSSYVTGPGKTGLMYT